MPETTYWERTDSFDEKLRLLQEAWKRRDYRVARALAASLRHTVAQAQHEEASPGTPLIPTAIAAPVSALPQPWREWAKGWSDCKVIALDETVGQVRPPEPVEVLLSFPAEKTDSLAREIRVARVENGALREVPCQVHGEIRRGAERFCHILFLANSPAHTRTHYLVFFGNPDAELPEYPTDLKTTGEGFGLDIENDFFKAQLSRQMGQLERLTFKREHGLELFAGGEGHGEPPGIDWAHDYVGSGNFQKFRVTLWDTPPDYEVVRGPLCTIVRRWGFPYSPVHPVFSPSRLHVYVEYRFFAGLPWLQKSGRMEAVKSFEADALRDDEWVFSGQSFTDIVWMGPDGKLRTGAVDKEHQDNLWGVGFVNKEARDGFIALFLEHRAEGLPSIRHNASPQMFYRWHGPVWSRYPLPGKNVPAGTVLHQKNAYLVLNYGENGTQMVETMRHRMMNPLAASPADLPSAPAKASPGRLARIGEAGDSPVSKKLLWDALRECKDEQLYRAPGANVVDLGLVYDLRVRGDIVTVVMAMPHRGRPRLGFFEYGSGGNNTPVRQRLMRVPGVRHVVVQQTWDPGWSSNRLTDGGRAALGL